MENNEIHEESEIELETGEDESIPYRYSITSFGADYPVDSLVKRLKSKAIYIPPFQRNFVWSLSQSTKFIESLLLGLPIPGIFLAKEDDNKMIVIDGQQRLKSLQMFYEESFNDKKFYLSGVQERFEGKTYSTLNEEDRLHLDDQIIHATIIKQDEPRDDDSSIYLIFERLNTGGLQLQPQEIRASIYSGKFNELLSELNELKEWREIFGQKSKRLKDQELILRFLALFYNRNNYMKPLRYFLNTFMSENKNLNKISEQDIKAIFTETLKYIHKAIGNKAFRPIRSINASAFDSIMVATADMISSGQVPTEKIYSQKYNSIISTDDFIRLVKVGTSDGEAVKARLKFTKDTFEFL
ncbi:DUF262 domain-containing protein [Leptospira sp. GIMC2001]|uniref:DUF262 domain-containing protein n=1 Tax=Leptospira sp. GIMC2001 TaxID=1513297 RepID=UPI00234A79F4|nr:DUF262 domain-containing protein [Leptospira sp. GIMC2001]WCL51472.1 DUF262 domain-containing protein [Leptospira sp. GIMC2001]